MCSAHVPLYSGLVPPSYRGVVSIDTTIFIIDYTLLYFKYCHTILIREKCIGQCQRIIQAHIVYINKWMSLFAIP